MQAVIIAPNTKQNSNQNNKENKNSSTSGKHNLVEIEMVPVLANFPNFYIFENSAHSIDIWERLMLSKTILWTMEYITYKDGFTIRWRPANN